MTFFIKKNISSNKPLSFKPDCKKSFRIRYRKMVIWRHCDAIVTSFIMIRSDTVPKIFIGIIFLTTSPVDERSNTCAKSCNQVWTRAISPYKSWEKISSSLVHGVEVMMTQSFDSFCPFVTVTDNASKFIQLSLPEQLTSLELLVFQFSIGRYKVQLLSN